METGTEKPQKSLLHKQEKVMSGMLYGGDLLNPN